MEQRNAGRSSGKPAVPATLLPRPAAPREAGTVRETAPRRTRGAKRGSSRRPGLRGGGRRGGEGVRDGSPSSDFGQRRRRAPNCGVERCRVKKWDGESWKVRTPRRGPVKRKEPSELKRRGGQKERGDPQGRNGSSAPRLKAGRLRRAAGISGRPRKEGGRRRLRHLSSPSSKLLANHPHPPPGWGRGRVFPPKRPPHVRARLTPGPGPAGRPPPARTLTIRLSLISPSSLSTLREPPRLRPPSSSH